MTSNDLREIVDTNSWFSNTDINKYIKVLYQMVTNPNIPFRCDVQVQSANLFVNLSYLYD